MTSSVPDPRDLVRWSDTLSAIARTGMGFTASLYEARALRGSASRRCRYQSGAHHLAEGIETTRETDHFVQEWLDNVGEGVPGYVTQKIAIGAVVGNDDGDILLVQRRESGVWLIPTGWADVGYSPSEVAVKEVEEETGIICEPVRLLSVIDGQRMGFSRFGMYMLLFHCRATGGTLRDIRSRQAMSVGSVRTPFLRSQRAPSGGSDGIRRNTR